MNSTDSMNRQIFSCETARRRTAAYGEGLLPQDEIPLMEEHLAECPVCSEELLPVKQLRRNLRTMTAPVVPIELRSRLQVAASHEAARRRRSNRSFAQVWKSWKVDVRLWADNLMRPLAIPTAGGFASALVLFSMFASGITMPKASAGSIIDVPTGLYTGASLKACMPLGFDSEDIVVELTIDDQGRVVDYNLPEIHNATSLELRRKIENHLLFTQFNPPTAFGQPVSGKVRLSFRSSRIDVKG